MSLSSREKILAGVVGGAVFLVFNFVAGKALLAKQADLRTQIAARTGELKTLQGLLSERELWEKRDAWLAGNQPKLTNENSAGVELLSEIERVAREHAVTLENKSFTAATTAQWYRSVAVNVETKSPWPALIAFLHAVQRPDQFIVFETSEVAIDSTDATQMRGKFRIARWYAP
jgi:hypothetical protein